MTFTMKRSPPTSKGEVINNSNSNSGYNNREIEWEMRPGGMLVQKRDSGDVSSGVMIKIKVSHGSYHHEFTVPVQSTFGDLKRILAQETGLEPKDQRLLFKGKEKEDEEVLDMVGVEDMSKIVLLEDPASRERKLEEMNQNQAILSAYEEVAKIREEVDKFSQKVVDLEKVVCGGVKVLDKEFLVLTELLMTQLLRLDSIRADGEAKVQRRIEVRRVQSLVDAIDNMKARIANPFNNGNTVSVTTRWETFESGLGSISAPSRLQSMSTKVTQDWEQFD